MNKYIALPVLFVFGLPVLAFASNVTICKNGNLERKVEVASTDSTKAIPCEVKYFKEGNPAGIVLWSAQNDATYCETKAKEFTEKLTSFGWACTAASEPTPEKPATSG